MYHVTLGVLPNCIMVILCYWNFKKAITYHWSYYIADKNHGLAYERRNGNAWKPPISSEIRNLIKQNFTREYEFYYFCKQRLYKQYFALQNLE